MIGYAGLTHLGLCHLTFAANALTRDVLGYAPDGVLPTHQSVDVLGEPFLAELMDQANRRITFTSNIQDLKKCEIIYITLDVDRHLPEDVERVHKLIDDVAAVMLPETAIVILSQVPPGFTRSITSVPHKYLFYQVDILAFGNSLGRLLEQRELLIGRESTEPVLPSILDRMKRATAAADLISVSYEEAELAKLAINCYLAAQLCVTNTLAELSAQIGAEWESVATCVMTDHRIGNYVKPGLGIGGDHLLRDVRSVKRMLKHPYPNTMVQAVLDHEAYMRINWLPNMLRSMGVESTTPVALWGMAYKTGTSSVVQSPAEAFAGAWGPSVKIHDDHVPQDVMFSNTKRCATPLETAEGAAVLIISTPWPEYHEVDLKAVRKVMRAIAVPPIIVDPYRLLDGDDVEEKGFTYRTIGG